jgi:hypothetical protein
MTRHPDRGEKPSAAKGRRERGASPLVAPIEIVTFVPLDDTVFLAAVVGLVAGVALAATLYIMRW